MDGLTRAGYLAHYQSDGMAQKIKAAVATLRSGLASAPRSYLSMSFGKDSAVCLHLLSRLVSIDKIDARFLRWPETDMLGDFSQVESQWADRGIKVTTISMSRGGLDSADAERWSALDAVADCDGVILGLRAEESRGRKITLRHHGDIYRLKSGMLRICPLAWWTTSDVAAYVVKHGVPVLSTYKNHGFGERTSARVPREAMRHEMMLLMRQRDPARAATLCEIYPDLARYQ